MAILLLPRLRSRSCAVSLRLKTVGAVVLCCRPESCSVYSINWRGRILTMRNWFRCGRRGRVIGQRSIVARRRLGMYRGILFGVRGDVGRRRGRSMCFNRRLRRRRRRRRQVSSTRVRRRRGLGRVVPVVRRVGYSDVFQVLNHWTHHVMMGRLLVHFVLMLLLGCLVDLELMWL